MLTPSCPNVTRTFYPFGDTPAVCLTENIPPDKKGEGKPVDILLLGSGDIRNVFFTTHMDKTRQLDITCCDVDRLVIARNILLLTLLIDPDFNINPSSSYSPGLPHPPPTSDDLFAIYYHQHLPENLGWLIRSQAMRLRLIGSTMSTWNASPYGRGRDFQPYPSMSKSKQKKGKGKQNAEDHIGDAHNSRNPTSGIRFTDSGTLKMLTQIWDAWFCRPDSTQQETLSDGLFKRLGTAVLKREQEEVGVPYAATRAAACSFRAAMPVGLEATFHATVANEDFWRWGATGSEERYDEDEDTDESTDTDSELEVNMKKQKADEGKGKEKERVPPNESRTQAQESRKKMTKRSTDTLQRRVINPLFTTPSPGVRIDHSCDPLQGFHLAPAYLPIVGQPPPDEGLSHLERLEAVAKQEFADWCNSFRRAWRKGRITLRFFIGDALAFAHTLQHHKAEDLGYPIDPTFGNWYRFRDSFDPLILDSDDYRIVPSESNRSPAPISFHVIDTSSLADDLGALNVLIAASPLLENRLAATLYTEHTLPLPRPSDSNDARLGPKTPQEVADTLLHGDLLTMSLLLGLSPVEYYTNTHPSPPPPTFSSPYSTSAPAPPSLGTPRPPPPPAFGASPAPSSTPTTTPVTTAQYFNQRLTWKRPVYHHPTDGSGRDWTISDKNNIWPGPSPVLHELVEEFARDFEEFEKTTREISEHLKALKAEECEKVDGEEEEDKEVEQGKGKRKGKAKKKKKPQKKKTTAKADIPEHVRNIPPEIREEMLDSRAFQQAAFVLRDLELRREFHNQKERWENMRTEMPLRKIRFQADELVEFLLQVYSRMYESRYLFERKTEGDGDGPGDLGAEGSAHRHGVGFRLLSPRTCNRATFASLLKIVQERVVILGDPLPTTDPSEDESIGQMDFSEFLDEIRKTSSEPDRDSVNGEISEILAATIDACRSSPDPSASTNSAAASADGDDGHGDSATTSNSSDRDANVIPERSDPYEPSLSPVPNLVPCSHFSDSSESDSESSSASTIIAPTAATFSPFFSSLPSRPTIAWHHTMKVMIESLKHSLVNYVETQGSFDQELCTILHHFGAYSSPEHAVPDPDALLKPRVYNPADEAIHSTSKHNTSLYQWINLPSSLAVTVRIPRHSLLTLKTIMLSLETGLNILRPEIAGGGRSRGKIHARYVPALQACIRPTHDHEDKPVANLPGHLFASLQTGFGQLETKGRRFTPRFRLNIETDPLGWEGQSDLFVSFMVPTSILLMDAVTGLVTLEVVPTIGPDVAGRNELSFMASGTLKMNLKEPVPPAVKTMMTAKLDENHQRISSISTRITFLTDRLLDRLENRECKIRSVPVTPCSYHLIISRDHTASFFSHGSNNSHLCPVIFLIDIPLPTNHEKQKIRAGRSKGFIEVETPIEPFAWRTFFTPSFMNPVHLEQSTQKPMNWSLPYLHSSNPSSLSSPSSSSGNPLDTLPRLCQSGPLIGCLPDPSLHSTNRFCLWWLQLQNHHYQFSRREATMHSHFSQIADPLPKNASPEEKEKQLKEKDEQFANALNRYLITSGEHARFEFKITLSTLFDMAAGILRPKSDWRHINPNIMLTPDTQCRSVFALCDFVPSQKSPDCTCHENCLDCGKEMGSGTGSSVSWSEGAATGNQPEHSRHGMRRIVIFVAKDGICLDLAHGTVILDTAVLVITKELRQSLPRYLTDGSIGDPMPIYNQSVMSQSMRTWKEALPAFAERCRGHTWEHGPTCEYKKKQRAPVANHLQSRKDDPVFCSCSMGKLPKSWSVCEDYPIPQLEEIGPYLVRAAISLPFGCLGLGEPYQHPMSWDPLLYPHTGPVTGVTRGAPDAVTTSAAAAAPGRAPVSTSTPAPATTGISQPPSANKIQANPTRSAPASVPTRTIAPTGTRSTLSAKALEIRPPKPASTSTPVAAATGTGLTQAQAQALVAKAARLALNPKRPSTAGQSSVQAPPPASTKSASVNAEFTPTTATTKPTVRYRCNFCNEPKNRGNGGDLNQCSKCKEARYCSKECQVADWKRHKKECDLGAGANAVNGKQKVKGNEKQKDKKNGK
ncbi:hypothetical protein B0T13DRAFT_393744 [Neurospora crassa]|nr:hypothetical protein B0T13DRAFT_393744 [Neurospora crassa]